MEIRKTIFNSRLLPAWTYLVTCGKNHAEFDASEKTKVGEWIMSVWASQEDGLFNVYSPAYVYYKWDYESNETLYCKYERV